jgi:uncharacterized protein
MAEEREGVGRTALITGASAGIGAALAYVFAAHGFDLVLTARRKARLEVIAREIEVAHDVRAHILTADLADPAAPADLVSALAHDGLAIDALVNNAGYSVAGTYLDTRWEEQRDFLQVLVRAPCELTHRLLPQMAERHYGRIMNVASVAGLMPGSASHTLYGGAKALMIKFSQSLHSEVKALGIHVSALCPGFTVTEFHDVNRTRGQMSRMPRFAWLGAERVACDGYEALMRNRAICIPGAVYKAAVMVAKWLPMGGAHRLGEIRSRMSEKP